MPVFHGIFYGYKSLIHAANYMFLILQNYQYTANDFPPYLFEKNFETGQLTKIIDTENAFQFKTFVLRC
jgi:hypothetical protein